MMMCTNRELNFSYEILIMLQQCCGIYVKDFTYASFSNLESTTDTLIMYLGQRCVIFSISCAGSNSILYCSTFTEEGT